jgi:hypothetical protein
VTRREDAKMERLHGLTCAGCAAPDEDKRC